MYIIILRSNSESNWYHNYVGRIFKLSGIYSPANVIKIRTHSEELPLIETLDCEKWVNHGNVWEATLEVDFYDCRKLSEQEVFVYLFTQELDRFSQNLKSTFIK